MGFVSEVFYTRERDFAFQRVDGFWLLYDGNGYFVNEFASFQRMINVMNEIRRVRR